MSERPRDVPGIELQPGQGLQEEQGQTEVVAPGDDLLDVLQTPPGVRPGALLDVVFHEQEEDLRSQARHLRRAAHQKPGELTEALDRLVQPQKPRDQPGTPEGLFPRRAGPGGDLERLLEEGQSRTGPSGLHQPAPQDPEEAGELAGVEPFAGSLAPGLEKAPGIPVQRGERGEIEAGEDIDGRLRQDGGFEGQVRCALRRLLRVVPEVEKVLGSGELEETGGGELPVAGCGGLSRRALEAVPGEAGLAPAQVAGPSVVGHPSREPLVREDRRARLQMLQGRPGEIMPGEAGGDVGQLAQAAQLLAEILAPPCAGDSSLQAAQGSPRAQPVELEASPQAVDGGPARRGASRRRRRAGQLVGDPVEVAAEEAPLDLSRPGSGGGGHPSLTPTAPAGPA